MTGWRLDELVSFVFTVWLLSVFLWASVPTQFGCFGWSLEISGFLSRLPFFWLGKSLSYSWTGYLLVSTLLWEDWTGKICLIIFSNFFFLDLRQQTHCKLQGRTVSHLYPNRETIEMSNHHGKLRLLLEVVQRSWSRMILSTKRFKFGVSDSESWRDLIFTHSLFKVTTTKANLIPSAYDPRLLGYNSLYWRTLFQVLWSYISCLLTIRHIRVFLPSGRAAVG